jgi:hypothetical protein
MTQHPFRTRIATVGLAGLLLLAGSTLGSYAANGGPLVLGHKNSATKTTTLKNSKGTALSLKSKSGKAPFKVSNNTLVTKLNADLVDGLDSSALQSKGYLYTLTGSQAGPLAFSFPGLPAGRYAVSVSVTATLSAMTSLTVLFINGTTSGDLRIPLVGSSTSAPGNAFLSGSGFIDTTAPSQAPYRIVLIPGTGTVSSPVTNVVGATTQSQVLFVPLDSLTTTAGTAGTFPKGAARTLK